MITVLAFFYVKPEKVEIKKQTLFGFFPDFCFSDQLAKSQFTYFFRLIIFHLSSFYHNPSGKIKPPY